MNAADVLFAEAWEEILSGNAGEVLSVGLEVYLAGVSDDDLATARGGYYFDNALVFEGERRAGKLVRWSVDFTRKDGVLSFQYSVVPTASIEYISFETAIGPPA